MRDHQQSSNSSSHRRIPWRRVLSAPAKALRRSRSAIPNPPSTSSRQCSAVTDRTTSSRAPSTIFWHSDRGTSAGGASSPRGVIWPLSSPRRAREGDGARECASEEWPLCPSTLSTASTRIPSRSMTGSSMNFSSTWPGSCVSQKLTSGDLPCPVKKLVKGEAELAPPPGVRELEYTALTGEGGV